MLSFAVFDEKGPASSWPQGLAYLFGGGDLPVQGSIRFEDGRLVCEKTITETVGLAVQFPVGAPTLAMTNGGGHAAAPLGVLALKTCLLPDRDPPYMLSLELARHRIMEFLNKLEDWSLFDLPADNAILQEFELARRTFSAALVAQRHDVPAGPPSGANGWGFSSEADRLARAALAQAIDAGEKLALLNAERQLPLRLTGDAYSAAQAAMAAITQEKPPSGTPILVPNAPSCVVPGLPAPGVAIAPDQFSEGLQRAAAAACEFVTTPMRWIDLEPGEGKYDFTSTDRWIEWAVRVAKVPITGGPLVDLRASGVPEWLYIWENDYETLRDLVYEHVNSIVTRYRRTVTRWTVCSGLHVNTNFKLSFEQIMDLTRLCVLAVKKLHPQGKIQVEIAQPWGEYHAEHKRSLPPLMYAEAVAQSGLPVDALGVRVQMGRAAPGQATRDLMAISAMLDQYALFGKPIAVSALGVPSVPGEPFEGRVGGVWRSGWTDAGQAEWLSRVGAICLSKPYMQSVCWQDLSDASAKPEMPGGGLVSGTGQPKPALNVIGQIRQAIRTGKGWGAGGL